MTLPDEWEIGGKTPEAVYDELTDLIDAAADQDHTTWITEDSGSKRIARIAPVEDDPALLLGIREDEMDELLEFAGQIRAAMRATRQAYDALFGASGARLLRAGQLQSPLTRGQAVLFRRLGRAEWEPGVFIRYGETGRPVISLASCGLVANAACPGIPAAPADLGARLAAKRAETEPAWREAMAATERLPVSRGLLVQVLTDAGLDEAKAETVWDVLHDLTHGIHPDGKPLGRPEPARSGRPEPLRPAGGLITVQVVQDALTLAGVHVSEEIIRNWSNGQAGLVYDWAIREHLHASDNEVARVPRPSFIPGPES